MYESTNETSTPADAAQALASPPSRAKESTSLYQAAFRRIFAKATERFDLRFWTGEVMHFGSAPPEFTLVIKDPRALASYDENSLAEAFIQGYWDVEGDPRPAFGLRRYLSTRTPVKDLLSLIGRIFLVDPTKNNIEAITGHYQLGDDFYLSFLDKKYRLYSHGHFRNEDESLEDSEEHKLQDMFDLLKLKPGMRLLAIGGGWGPVPQFCGERGVKVTSITLAPDSHRYISNLIQERNLPCEVVLGDFLEHRFDPPFDAVVIYGVIEHIPQYKRFVEKVYQVLKPNGLMYLDGSASRTKYDMNWVARKYIWPTTTAYLATHDLIAELNYAGFHLLELKNESRDYELTMLHWSRRFEQAKELIVQRWGEKLYRIFRIYLWSGHIAFRDDGLQAYRMVIQRGEQPGPRPGLLKRALYAAWGAF